MIVYRINITKKMTRATLFRLIMLITYFPILIHADATNSNEPELISNSDEAPPHYQQFETFFFSPEAPGFNHPDHDAKFDGIQPIPFKAEDLSTGTLTHEDKNRIGYFWNTKDNDPTLIYQGKARIDNDQFINVVVVNTNNVDQTGQADSFSYTSQENIYDIPPIDKQKFHDDFLVKIGSFIRKGQLYDVYGQYMASVIPDPETIEYT